MEKHPSTGFLPSGVLTKGRSFGRILFAAGLLLVAWPGKALGDDLAIVEGRVLDSIMAGLPSYSTVTNLTATLGVNGLWPDLVYNNSLDETHLTRMKIMAKAYASPSSALYANAALRDDYFSAFDGWIAEDPTHLNWWFNEIKYPQVLGESMLIMQAEISAPRMTSGLALIARSYKPRSNNDGRNAGANRIDRSYATMLRGLLSDDGPLVAESFLSIGDTILFTNDEGMQPDGSYHQHGEQLYIGGYGLVFTSGVSKYAGYGAGTIYSYSPRQVRELMDYMLDGAQWFIRGQMIEYTALGRSVSRMGSSTFASRFTGHLTKIQALAGAYRSDEANAFLARQEDSSTHTIASPELALSGNRCFWRSDYMAHHRPEFLAGVKISSNRTTEPESGNGEGLKNLHLADGVMLIERRGDEYADLMPVWNWKRLPGTTIEQASYSTKPASDFYFGHGTSTHAGGVSDGRDGAMAFDYSRRNISARKSWFFFGDAIVALGAGINAPAATSPVRTTLNQCHLTGPVSYSTGGSTETLAGTGASPAGLQWAHHDGIGYFFPGGTSAAYIRSQAQSGSWYDINNTLDSTVITQQVFSLDINHGTAFSGGSYAYVVVPGLDITDMATYPLDDLVVLTNTANCQAVSSGTNGLLMANFFAAGSIGGLTVDRACSVMMREKGGIVEVTASDPTQNQTTDLHIQLQRPVAGLIEADGEITVDQLSPTLSMHVRIDGSTGRSLRAKFFTESNAYTTVSLEPVADSYVYDGSPDSNYGATSSLYSKLTASDGYLRETYLRFDLSGVTSTPVAARLKLYPLTVAAEATRHIVKPLADSPWSETGITWNNRPLPAGAATAPWLVTAGQAVSVDVLKPLQDFSVPGGMLSLWVAPSMQSADGLVIFASRENATTAWRPQLELTFLSAPTVDNSAGATVLLTPGVVRLNGSLSNGPADVTIYWGPSDGGTNGSWAFTNKLTGVTDGAFSCNVSNLIYGQTYYYRCQASSTLYQNESWAPATAAFSAPRNGDANGKVTDTFTLVSNDAALYTPTAGAEIQSFTLTNAIPDGSFMDAENDGYGFLHRVADTPATIGILRSLGVVSDSDIGKTIIVDAAFRHTAGLNSVWELMLDDVPMPNDAQMNVSSFGAGQVSPNSNLLLSEVPLGSNNPDRSAIGPLSYTILPGDVGKLVKLKFSLYDSTNEGGEGTRNLGVDAVSFQVLTMQEVAYSAWIQGFGLTSSSDKAVDYDYDFDGLDNWSEFISGTDPTNKASVFSVTSSPDEVGFIVSWNAVSNREYGVWHSGDLTGALTNLASGINFPQNSYTDTIHAAGASGFYKLDVQLIP